MSSAIPSTSAQEPQITVRVHKVGPPKIYVTWRGETYSVQIFQSNGSNQETNVTGERDWHAVAEQVLSCLHDLDGQDKFSFKQMQTADVFLQGSVALESSKTVDSTPAKMTKALWARTITNSPDREITLSKDTDKKLEKTLKTLGTELATWKPPVSTSQQSAKKLARDVGKKPLTKASSSRSSSPHKSKGPAPKKEGPAVTEKKPGPIARPTYLGTSLNYEAGGGGDCGAKALAAALIEKEGTYYADQHEWQAAVNAKSKELREKTMQYILNNPRQFISDDRLALFINALKEDGKFGIQKGLSEPDKEKLEKLLEQKSHTDEEKIWIVQLYAMTAFEAGVWLDKPFFLAHAIRNKQPVVLVQPRKDPKTLFFADSVQKIDAEKALFVYYDGSCHFQSVYRQHKDLQGYIDLHNASHQFLFAREYFLNAIDTGNWQEIQKALKELKEHDLPAYLTIQSLGCLDLEKEAFVEKLTEELNNIDSTKRSLSQKLETHFNRRSDLQARAQFLQALVRAKSSKKEVEALKTALRNLIVEDTGGYMAVVALTHSAPGKDVVTRFCTALEITSEKKENAALQGADAIENQLKKIPLTRVAFFQKLMKFPSNPSEETKAKLYQTLEAWIKNDIEGTDALPGYASEFNALLTYRVDALNHVIGTLYPDQQLLLQSQDSSFCVIS